MVLNQRFCKVLVVARQGQIEGKIARLVALIELCLQVEVKLEEEEKDDILAPLLNGQMKRILRLFLELQRKLETGMLS